DGPGALRGDPVRVEGPHGRHGWVRPGRRGDRQRSHGAQMGQGIDALAAERRNEAAARLPLLAIGPCIAIAGAPRLLLPPTGGAGIGNAPPEAQLAPVYTERAPDVGAAPSPAPHRIVLLGRPRSAVAPRAPARCGLRSTRARLRASPNAR